MSYNEDGHQNASNLQHIADNAYQSSYKDVMLVSYFKEDITRLLVQEKTKD